MDASTLRAIQAPLKAQYRSSPSTALLTLSATGTLDSTSITCSLSSSSAIKTAVRRAGLHPATGGSAPAGDLCSGDMLLEALVGCAGVTLKAVATALEIEILGGEVKAEGDLDVRGTLGVDKEAPVGFVGVRLAIEVQVGEGVGEEKLQGLLRLTERYCVVLQTIRGGVEVRSEIKKVDGGEEEM